MGILWALLPLFGIPVWQGALCYTWAIWPKTYGLQAFNLRRHSARLQAQLFLVLEMPKRAVGAPRLLQYYARAQDLERGQIKEQIIFTTSTLHIMKTLESTLLEFIALVRDYRYQEALDQFYHPDVVKHENENAPTIGLYCRFEVLGISMPAC